jgi:hypothetical protein
MNLNKSKSSDIIKKNKNYFDQNFLTLGHLVTDNTQYQTNSMVVWHGVRYRAQIGKILGSIGGF